MGKKLNMESKYEKYGYFFITPFFLVFLLFNFYPMVNSILTSFYSTTNNVTQFVGLQNYVRLIYDTQFFQSLYNTAVMWIIGFIPQLIFAITLAAILSDKDIKVPGRGFFRAVYYLPNLVTLSSIGLLMYYFLDKESGSLNKILMSLHILQLPYDWNQDTLAVRCTVAFTSWWIWFGFTMIIFMAGISAIPDELFEAARVDGANKWQTFWNVTIPSIKGSVLYNIITSIIGGLSMFDVPYVLTGGSGTPLGDALFRIKDSPEQLYQAMTTVNYMYNMTFRNYDSGYGSTIYVGMFVVILVIVAFSFRILNNNFSKE